MTEAGRVVVLRPGDVLFVSNVSALEDVEPEQVTAVFGPVARALGLRHVSVFGDDIDVAAVAQHATDDTHDAVVLRMYDREMLAAHRADLAVWLDDNGIDPTTVAADWLTVEQAGTQRIIRYLACRVDQDGRRLTDPRCPGRPWTVERIAPLVVESDILDKVTVTACDDAP